MRKFFLFVLAGFAVITGAKAQTEKGDWLVGGNMTINTTEGNSEFSLLPSSGYFFARNFAAGAEFKLAFTKRGDERNSIQGVGPFARYYFNLKNGDLKPLLHANYNFANQTTKIPSGKTRNTVTSLFIGGGAAYFINQNVALEALAGYNRSKVENASSQGGFLFRLGFQVHLLGNEVKEKVTRD